MAWDIGAHEYTSGPTNTDIAVALGSAALTGTDVGVYVGQFLDVAVGDALAFAGVVPTLSEVSTVQRAAPTSDVSNAGLWAASSGSDLYAMVADTATPGLPDDSTYIRSPEAPASATVVLGLAALQTPDAGTVTLRVRARWVN